MGRNEEEKIFIEWIGKLAYYMKAEHDVDLIAGFQSSTGTSDDAKQECLLFLLHNYQGGHSPRDVADRLINSVNGLYD